MFVYLGSASNGKTGIDCISPVLSILLQYLDQAQLMKPHRRYTSFTLVYTSFTPVYTSFTPVYTRFTPVYTRFTPVYTSFSPVYTSFTPVYTSFTPVYTSFTPVFPVLKQSQAQHQSNTSLLG